MVVVHQVPLLVPDHFVGLILHIKYDVHFKGLIAIAAGRLEFELSRLWPGLSVALSGMSCSYGACGTPGRTQ